MSPKLKVAVAGASCTLGRHIVSALIQSNAFQVTALTRGRLGRGRLELEPLEYPPEVAEVEVNYNSVAHLESVLQGHEAVVSLLPLDALDAQKNIAHAASNAGVSRMIPSEFGHDTSSLKLRMLPIFEPKIEMQKHLEELVSANPSFSYTLIMNGLIIGPDSTLDKIVNVRKRQADLKDGGAILFSASTYEDVASAVVRVLINQGLTANHTIKICSIYASQNEIITRARRLGAVGDWEITHTESSDLEQEARRRWASGDHGREVIDMFMSIASLGLRNTAILQNLDHHFLGLTRLSLSEFDKMIEKAINREE